MSDARIFDQGYRRYEGERRGRVGAMSSLARNSALRALGLRRTFWAKVLPIASVTIAYLPAAVFIGVAAIVPEDLESDLNLLPDFAGYYGFITAAIVLFVSAVGPEVLCPDRRTGMLGLYLASPLTRDTYLVAKAIAILPVLALVTLGPPLLLLIGFAFADAGPETAGDFATVFLRVVASGLVMAAVYTAVSLAVSSFTDRRAVASAGVILSLLASSVVTGALIGDGEASALLVILNVFVLPLELVFRIYGQPGEWPEVGTASLVVGAIGWIVLSALVVRWRYHRLTVTR